MIIFISNKNVNATIFLNLPCIRLYVIDSSKSILTLFSQNPKYLNGISILIISINRKLHRGKSKNEFYTLSQLQKID
jgi:hypothetical protein